jgi:hypothetical protein
MTTTQRRTSMFIDNYPRHLVVDYTTDDEYRACFARIFGMTRDEDGNFVTNEVFINKRLQDLFRETKHDSRFSELYNTAMICMGSSEPLDGILLLCSFHCLPDYHMLISEFLKKRDTLTGVVTEGSQNEEVSFRELMAYFREIMVKSGGR